MSLSEGFRLALINKGIPAERVAIGPSQHIYYPLKMIVILMRMQGAQQRRIDSEPFVYPYQLYDIFDTPYVNKYALCGIPVHVREWVKGIVDDITTKYKALQNESNRDSCKRGPDVQSPPRTVLEFAPIGATAGNAR